jgi:hypothetical protein
MAFVAVPNACKVVTRFDGQDYTWTNTLWFTKYLFDHDDQAELTALCDTGFGLALTPSMNSQCGYTLTQSYDMRTAYGDVIVVNTSAALGTASGGDMLAPSTCLVCTLRTGERGRAGRGRLYLAGFGEGLWTVGRWSTDLITAVEAVLEGLKLGALALGWTHVLVSRQLNGEVRTPPATIPVTDYDFRSTRPGSQRRRNARG